MDHHRVRAVVGCMSGRLDGILDGAGNALHGAVHALASTGNVVHADAGAVVLYGVSDLVVVTRDGLTLVTTIDRAADLKTLLESLPPQMKSLS